MNVVEIATNESVVKAPTKEPKKKKDNRNPVKHHFCKDCKWYDKDSERQFHRNVGKKNGAGNRTEIIELRALCKNSKARSFHHLVMAEYSKRQCGVWESKTPDFSSTKKTKS